jgi:hypothetical protein
MEENRSNSGNRGFSLNIGMGLIFIGGRAVVILNQLGILPTQPI